ncbi:PEP-CTERM sorting domain-containing protein [Kiritimatiellaeota bacterium B1221]|nr:PEP-CTERM sorting domain-containing protein [Kiritimatiellaeota bacterium B1221]
MKTTPSIPPLYCTAILTALSFFMPAFSQTILIDFGPTATSSLPETWNNVTQRTDDKANLLDINGDATGIAMSTSTGGFGGTSSWNDGEAPSSAMFDAFEVGSVMTDGIYVSNGNVGTITFSGLDMSKTYEITLTAARKEGEERYTRYAIAGYGTQILQVAGDNPYAGTGTTTWNNDDFITFSGITGMTTFDLTVQGNQASDFTGAVTWGYVNALQISAIPEPSSLLLLGLSFLGLIVLRRRK